MRCCKFENVMKNQSSHGYITFVQPNKGLYSINLFSLQGEDRPASQETKKLKTDDIVLSDISSTSLSTATLTTVSYKGDSEEEGTVEGNTDKEEGASSSSNSSSSSCSSSSSDVSSSSSESDGSKKSKGDDTGSNMVKEDKDNDDITSDEIGKDNRDYATPSWTEDAPNNNEWLDLDSVKAFVTAMYQV